MIDDGSTDDTLKVAQSYAERDSRVRVFHQENTGPSAARNYGIREAKGEYFIFLDSDDWLEDDAVEIMVSVQIENPDRLVAVNFWQVSFDDKRKDIFLREKCCSVPSRKMKALDTVYAQCEDTISSTAWAKIFYADIIRRYELRFSEELCYREDTIFELEYLLMMSGSVYLDKPLFNILSRPGSLTRTHSLTPMPFSDRMQISKEMWYKVIFNRLALTPELHVAFRVFCGIANVYVIISDIHDKLGREFIITRREKVQQFMREVLSSAHVSTKSKLKVIYAMYFPVPLARLAMFLWRCLRPLRNRGKKEIIPYW